MSCLHRKSLAKGGGCRGQAENGGHKSQKKVRKPLTPTTIRSTDSGKGTKRKE